MQNKHPEPDNTFNAAGTTGPLHNGTSADGFAHQTQQLRTLLHTVANQCAQLTTQLSYI